MTKTAEKTVKELQARVMVLEAVVETETAKREKLEKKVDALLALLQIEQRVVNG